MILRIGVCIDIYPYPYSYSAASIYLSTFVWCVTVIRSSIIVTDHFIDFLYKVYQQDWVEEFKKEDPAAYAELIDNFRVAKQEFWKSEKGHKDNDDAAEKAGDGNGDMDELSEVMSIDEKLKLYQGVVRLSVSLNEQSIMGSVSFCVFCA